MSIENDKAIILDLERANHYVKKFYTMYTLEKVDDTTLKNAEILSNNSMNFIISYYQKVLNDRTLIYNITNKNNYDASFKKNYDNMLASEANLLNKC